MVPDVSTGPIRRPLQNLNSIEDSLSKTIPSKKQPERQQPPVREEFKPLSEFSRLVISDLPELDFREPNQAGHFLALSRICHRGTIHPMETFVATLIMLTPD